MKPNYENWPDLLQQPTGGDHFVQVYSDKAFLCNALAEYAGTGLRRGEGVIVIATEAHRALFVSNLEADGIPVAPGQLVMLDAAETLARFMQNGMPDWQSFHALVGGIIAKLRLDFPTVRAYGEMVDVLWQQGEQEAALRLEEFWNDLARLQTFSLLCAYHMDPLDAGAYSGPLECICKVHSHLIPAADYEKFNRAVIDASEAVLDQPLARMLRSLSSQHRPTTAMPEGQATLLWLKRNMPRTADKVLAEVRSRVS